MLQGFFCNSLPLSYHFRIAPYWMSVIISHCSSCYSMTMVAGCPTPPSPCNSHLPPLRGSLLRAPCWRPSQMSAQQHRACPPCGSLASNPVTLWVCHLSWTIINIIKARNTIFRYKISYLSVLFNVNIITINILLTSIILHMQLALGQYPEEHFNEIPPCRMIQKFQTDLKVFSETVKARNSGLPVPYTYMDPALVENSVAI